MQEASHQQFREEQGNWLSRGRSLLIAELLARHLPLTDERPQLLEIGAGFGENLPTLDRFGAVDAIEIAEAPAEHLATRAEARIVHRQPVPDLVLDQHYHAIVAWDVLEHIERDDLAVDWIHDHLTPGGVLLAAVPAYGWLFSDHDRALDHHRRYTRAQLAHLLGERLHLHFSSYFNTSLFPLAVTSRILWQTQRRLLGRSGTPEKQPSGASGPIDDRLGRVLAWEARRVGAGWRAPFGLTAIAVAERA